jgi:prepilin-type processing-associated H-X9-DG protein
MRRFPWRIILALAAIFLLVALLLPAKMGSSPGSPARTDLRQMALALSNYEPTNGTFPRAILDEKGRPLLSWRVAILPSLEEGALYEEFHPDEPWDSEHNRKLIGYMPKTYYSRKSKAPPGATTFLAVCGKGLMLDGDKRRTSKDIRDGLSKTIMLVQVNDDRAVPWTKPEDWECDPGDPLAGLGSAERGGFHVAFCDGSVSFIRKDIDPKLFYGLLTVAGGENVDRFTD